MACKICNTRRERRFCPGVGGQICSVCCGTGREETVSCPLDCVYLREARAHEKRRDIPPEEIPNLDIKVGDSFLRQNEHILAFLIHAVADAALSTEGAVDFDVRDTFDSMVRSWRTRESGLYYESRPDNRIAANVQARVEKSIEDFRRAATERYGLTTIRDADILGMLAFLQRVEYQINNGRKRGRAFIDFLRTQTAGFQAQEPPPEAPSLLVP